MSLTALMLMRAVGLGVRYLDKENGPLKMGLAEADEFKS